MNIRTQKQRSKISLSEIIPWKAKYLPLSVYIVCTSVYIYVCVCVCVCPNGGK